MLKSTSSADGPNIITSTTLTAPKTVMAVPINGYNFAFDIMSVTPTPSLNSQPGTNIPSPGLSPTTSAFSAGSTTPSTGIVASAELSTGAKAGIGVAVALVGILIVGVSVFAWRRRHLRQARLVQGVANNKLVAAVEKDSSTMHEMPHTGSSQPRVFQPPSSPQELHG
ncbi:hypothetical protein BGZ60DRAFT_406389 [Tricladium varicosporioides]|nr:hypothetical protein BGZ60DRAFT_406389 [Hymenoscyphus varicosporioides]